MPTPETLRPSMTTFLAQLTDLHIREPGRLTYRRIDTAQYLERTVQSVLALPQPPHALVITGDLTDFGRPAEYAHLRVVPGHSEGALCEERLQWLELQLAASEGRPVVIAMHHPPFETLIGHMDKIGLLQGAQALEDLVRRHPNVQRVICGHLHRSIQVAFGGTVAMTSPAPAHQVCLDLAPDAASAWTLEPPGFMLHAQPPGGRLVSHAVASGQFDGPHPFWDAQGRLID